MTKVTKKGITVGDFTFDITVEGPEDEAGTAAMDLHDRAVRIARAFEDDVVPEEAEGIGISIDWQGVIGGEYE